jgi:hypothetical protein
MAIIGLEFESINEANFFTLQIFYKNSVAPTKKVD